MMMDLGILEDAEAGVWLLVAEVEANPTVRLKEQQLLEANAMLLIHGCGYGKLLTSDEDRP